MNLAAEWESASLQIIEFEFRYSEFKSNCDKYQLHLEIEKNGISSNSLEINFVFQNLRAAWPQHQLDMGIQSNLP